MIDFIDMEEAKNNRAVEKKVKDSLKDDRARIQMGKISQFGLMEISRQRRRAGVLEGTTHVCPHCQGVGRVRSVESSALSMLRSVELEAAKNGPGVIHLRVPSAVALYILNEKRTYLMRLQQQQGLTVNVLVDDNLADVDHEIERISTLTGEEARAFVAPARALPAPEEDDDLDLVDEDEEDEEEEDEEQIEEEDEDDDEASARVSSEQPREARESREGREEGGRGGRRRRRRRGPRRDDIAEEPRKVEGEAREETESEAEGEDEDGEDRNGRRRRRRGRRGGRRAREEVRVADPYGWVRVRVPHVDGVYSWYDPALAMPQARQPGEAHAEAPAQVHTQTQATAQVARAPVAAAQPESDIWSSCPPPRTSRPARAVAAAAAVAAEAVRTPRRLKPSTWSMWPKRR